MTSDQLERELLDLPAHERARLAKRLIESLEVEIPALDRAATEEAWKAEIGRRLDAMDQGEVEMIPAEEALARARKLISS